MNRPLVQRIECAGGVRIAYEACGIYSRNRGAQD